MNNKDLMCRVHALWISSNLAVSSLSTIAGVIGLKGKFKILVQDLVMIRLHINESMQDLVPIIEHIKRKCMQVIEILLAASYADHIYTHTFFS